MNQKYWLKNMKKTNYFTEENRLQKIKHWKTELASIYSNKKPFKFNPVKAALLIVDMQLYFTDKNSHAFIPSSEVIFKPILDLKEKFHQLELPVIITRYGLSDKIEEESIMIDWWNGSLKQSDPLVEIHPLIKDDWAITVEKSTYDCFYQTNLDELLQEQQIEQIVIVGLVTHLCVETTARNAFTRNYQVFLPVDCIASYNEEIHLSSLKAAAHGFGIPATSQELLEKFEHD
ncbi:MAG: isochorismatase family protein [Asgard group archaeon]|nr:isochorismatase family protein [Asgard group archaeon]